jgi:hypothetical protein
MNALISCCPERQKEKKGEYIWKKRWGYREKSKNNPPLLRRRENSFVC